MPPYRALDVVSEVGHPVGGAHQRRPLPRHRVCQPHPVGRATERDVLPHWRLLGQFGFFCGFGGWCVVDDGADELVPAAAHRPDVALRLAVIT